MTRPVSVCIVGFANCSRFVGVAIVDRGVKIRVTRIARSASAPLERVRVAAWAESVLALHKPGLVALTLHGPHDHLVREAAARHGYSSFDLERSEIARLIGATAPTIAALRVAVVSHSGCSLVRGLRLRRDARGPRSEFERYWAMPILALAAALAARVLASRDFPRVPPPP